MVGTVDSKLHDQQAQVQLFLEGSIHCTDDNWGFQVDRNKAHLVDSGSVQGYAGILLAPATVQVSALELDYPHYRSIPPYPQAMICLWQVLCPLVHFCHLLALDFKATIMLTQLVRSQEVRRHPHCFFQG